MSTTSSVPEPHRVLQPDSTTTPPSVLYRASMSPQEQREMQLKFFIGLRLLGEEKAKRLLAFIQILQQEQEQEQSK